MLERIMCAFLFGVAAMTALMKLEICMADAKLDRICGVDCTFRAQILGFFETVVDFFLFFAKHCSQV